MSTNQTRTCFAISKDCFSQGSLFGPKTTGYLRTLHSIRKHRGCTHLILYTGHHVTFALFQYPSWLPSLQKKWSLQLLRTLTPQLKSTICSLELLIFTSSANCLKSSLLLTYDLLYGKRIYHDSYFNITHSRQQLGLPYVRTEGTKVTAIHLL
jgi:hypothetical protein